MCGILGFNWKDKKLAKKLADLIKHRGPDGEGFYVNNGVSLGHRRLSIIDLSEAGKQPMCNEDKSIWITYNGEVFNFRELKKKLMDAGHIFISNTDTEVIVHGYEEWGAEVVDRLNGQFAFCIYDENKKELFLARDRLGINPLYYYFDGVKFIFGSELKVMLESGIKKEIDKFAFNYYLMYGYTPRKQSMVKNCFKLEAGHYMRFSLEKKEITEYKRYWNFRFSNEIKDQGMAKKLILEQLKRSVEARLMGDVPVGAFLSGGVDSSAVVAMMSKFARNINTFSVKFDMDEYDESQYGMQVSEIFKTKHHVVEFSAKDIKMLIPTLAYHYDEPLGDPSLIPMFLVSKVARKYVTVSLSGDGGDEIFGGYGRYRIFAKLRVHRYYPTKLNGYAGRIIRKTNVSSKVKSFFEIGALPNELRYANLASYLSTDEFRKISDYDPIEIYKGFAQEHMRHYLNEAINNDLMNYLAGDILAKVDRAALGNSIEARPPLLDHEMVELALRIDPKLKLKNDEGKLIFKKSLEGVLPNNILYRKKQGFSVPLKHYLRGELRDQVEKYLINYKKHDLIKKEAIETIKEMLEKKHWEKDHSRIIWSLMMFNMWWDTWIKN